MEEYNGGTLAKPLRGLFDQEQVESGLVLGFDVDALERQLHHGRGGHEDARGGGLVRVVQQTIAGVV